MDAEATFHLERDPHSVRFWSKTRLPFEPRGQLREARDSLRTEIETLIPSPGYILSAKYQSLDQEFFDVENILFYNVGTAAFRSAAGEGLHFERLHAAPPLSSCGRQFSHYHEYRLDKISPGPDREPECSLDFTIPRLSSSTKPHEIWWLASTAGNTSCQEFFSPFEMRVIIHSPSPFHNLASVIKPLLDGVISAFHCDETPNDDAVNRLAEKTGWPVANILHRLRSPRTPVLGPRRLLDAYRDFIKWNPADELCESCTVLFQPSPSRRCLVDLWKRK